MMLGGGNGPCPDVHLSASVTMKMVAAIYAKNRTASTHGAAKPRRLKLHKRAVLYDRVKHHFALEDLKH
jgi:hypothetical protein